MPALCLDFDGTIRQSKSGKKFIEGPGDIELIGNIDTLIWKFRNSGWLIFGISNQSSVAFGFTSPATIDNEMEATLELFDKNPFHEVRYCFFNEKGNVYPFKYRSLLRKPNTGMLACMEEASWKKGCVVDWDKSLFVGDRPEDEQCAQEAGIRFLHINDFLKIRDTDIITVL